MLASALMLLMTASAQAPDRQETIVVVGRKAEEELAECLARHCPPAEEIEASLQASVEQFADARYADARQTLQRAIRRNRHHAAQLPGPVSSLHATLATVAEHEGDRDLWLRAERDSVLVLRRHAGLNNPATLMQELTQADTMVQQGLSVAADEAYASVHRRAQAEGLRDLAAAATFRRAYLAYALERYDRARRLADEAVAAAGERAADIEEMRGLLHERIAFRRGADIAQADVAARMRRSPTDRPVLLFADRKLVQSRVGDSDLDRGANRLLDDGSIRFADVGFWIMPNGQVGEVEVLRQYGLGQLRSTILDHVATRQYAALDLPADHPGIYRIERFTMRGEQETPTGSRIAMRAGTPRLRIVDLTETEAMSDVHRQRSRQQSAALPN
ncbi:hypothetical protein EYB45_01260 [Erythrobacteraceae bacterium CFH 75059]|uniref:hypothetical protein n=1 Tax=Qipengyuania thermophila TaxID=2509361 RepID=UPI0010210D2C|nr:hypothetical protein [Qipengyuania thermophila]TCD06387.1 hypothetical protein EYB45_01260 [Erythrobacteraceae bacterium CFH 75059]